jgi:hypothetical protein
MTVNHWRDSIADVHDAYIPQSHPLTISRLTTDGLYPSVGAPQFSQFGGEVPDGFNLTMSTTSAGATIWYTTNGQDPRLVGGAVNSGSANAFSGSVVIENNTTIKARTRAGTTWSALTEATFVVSPTGGGIVLSEINYHPYDVTAAEAAAIPGVVEDDFEFIEIHNTHPTKSINLMNMSLAGGLAFTFGSASLGPGQYALVVEDVAAFDARYGTGHSILGQWSGGLSNSGETIELRDALGKLIMAVSYTDAAPWSRAADGTGPTLELINPTADVSDPANWRASYYAGGTPGSQRLTLPGDYNRDYVVDAADNGAWRAGFGRSVEAETGADGNGDGVVDTADYVVWRNNLGSTALVTGAAWQQTVVAAEAAEIGVSAVTPVARAQSTAANSAPSAVRGAKLPASVTPSVVEIAFERLDARHWRRTTGAGSALAGGLDATATSRERQPLVLALEQAARFSPDDDAAQPMRGAKALAFGCSDELPANRGCRWYGRLADPGAIEAFDLAWEELAAN